MAPGLQGAWPRTKQWEETWRWHGAPEGTRSQLCPAPEEGHSGPREQHTRRLWGGRELGGPGGGRVGRGVAVAVAGEPLSPPPGLSPEIGP